MQSLLFVHGINVRGEAWFLSLELIAQKAAKFLPGITVAGCEWGNILGAYLHKDGVSIPDFEDTADASHTVEYADRGRWFLLGEDPLLELRILPQEDYLGERPGIATFARIPPLAQEFTIIELLTKWRVERPWPEFITAITSDPDWKTVIECTTANAPSLSPKLARAITAAYQRDLRARGYPSLGGRERDSLRDALISPLGGPPLGVMDWLLDRLTNFGKHRRGRLSDKATPLAGDVIRYQSRGEEIRKYIAHRVSDTSATVLLAHSLGGVACVDWLASNEYAEHGPRIDRLITIGSQAPYFYEIDALVSRPYGAGLPDAFPQKWLNIYDRSDFLSYLAAPIFPNNARDVEVDNGQPFPDSHSAYWHNDAQVWPAVRAFLAEA